MEEKVNDEEKPKRITTVKFSINGMPQSLFNEWNQDCISKYGDCRWMKAFNDHKKAEKYEEMLTIYSSMLASIGELEARVMRLEKSKQEQVTLG
jgi:hypothetical protein